MSDRSTLMLLEAIRLEIRAAADVVFMIRDGKTCIGVDTIRQRADKLSRMGFDNISLANDEKEALGQ